MGTHVLICARLDDEEEPYEDSSQESVDFEEDLPARFMGSQGPSQSSLSFEFSFTYPVSAMVEEVAKLSVADRD